MNEAVKIAIARFVGCAHRPGPRNPKKSPDAGSPLPSAVVLENPTRRAAQRLTDKGFAHIHRFVVLPCSKGPRWLLPLGHTHRTLEGFQIYTPYAPRARILKAIVLRAIKAGWDGWGWPRVLVASRGPLPLEVLVRQVTGEREPTFAMSLGVGGIVRKLTVQVMRPNGEILGYIKLPLADAAAERVRRETGILTRLWDFPPLHPHIPRVLYAGEWSDGFILFQSPGPPSPGPAAFGPLHEDFLRTLRGTYEVEKPGREVVEGVNARWQKAAPLLDVELRALGERALERALREMDGTTIPCGLTHGDFVPWNTRVDDGRLFLLDWESATGDIPFIWDVFHFQVQVARMLNPSSDRILPLGQSPAHNASFLLYLLNSVSDYVEEAVAGHPNIEYRKRILRRQLAQ